MSIEGEYEPSPWEPIAEQVALYERTGGAEGSTLEGAPCIILWTLGARTDRIRKTPLMRIEDDGSYAVIGSMGGAPEDPKWVHNLRTTPEARLQDGAVLRDYAVREVDGDEKARWWTIATGVWPSYDDYQASTGRVIPLFVLSPT